MADELTPAQQLRTFREQLEQVEAALQAAPGDTELVNARADLAELVKTLAEVVELEEAQRSGPTGGGGSSGASFQPGDKVLACASDGAWRAARIIAARDGGFEVKLVGPHAEEITHVSALEVKAYDGSLLATLAPSMPILAYYAGDDGWWPAKVRRTLPSGHVEVNYDGYDDVVALEPECVKDAPQAGGSLLDLAQAAEPGNGAGSKKRAGAFHIPASLEIKPEDPPEVVAKKRKKIKSIKNQAHKAEQADKADEQRSNWHSFVNKKGKRMDKLTRNNHDPLFDPERDHQEMARRYRTPARPRETW